MAVGVVFFVLLAAASIYLYAFSSPDILGSSRARLSPGGASMPEPMIPDEGHSFVTLTSDEFLDPIPGKNFIVSFMVRFEQLPPQGKHHKIIFKYASDTPPYPGWAVGIRRLQTAARPEVYWRDAQGDGGWFAFDSFNIELGHWYSFDFVAAESSFIGLYVEDCSQSEVNSQIDKQEDGDSDDDIRFFGGYETTEISFPQTSGDLFIRSGSSSGNGTFDQVADVLIVHKESLPDSRPEMKRLCRGKSDKLTQLLETSEVGLWIGDSGEDKSRFRRTISTSANSR